VKALVLFSVLSLVTAKAQNVLTAGYDSGRTNANLNETILSPATVKPVTFGKLFSLPVDGQVYVQPLYEQNVSVAGQAHNVVFVATQHNSVYAFDADSAGPPLWTVNLGPSVASDIYDTADGPYTDIAPEIGILGTPVIDSSTGVLYVVAATMESGNFYHRLHALDVGSGAERFGAPVVINAQVSGVGENNVNGTVPFVSLQHIQRPALLLSNGVVYVAFGSHGDGDPWHGWMMGYRASNVQLQTAVFNSSANGWGGAIWQSGRGPSVDSNGNIYVVTSNGDSDNLVDFSDSVLKLDPVHLIIEDWFAPSDQQTLDDDDDDLGTAGPILIPGTNLLITGGKQGLIYLLNTGSLGHMTPTNSQIPQSFAPVSFGIFNMAVWNRTGGQIVYMIGANSPFSAYQLAGNQLNLTPLSQSSSLYAVPFQGMTISASGGQPGSGILWVTTADSWPLPATGTVHAFDADNLSSELWNSSTNPTDSLSGFSKFANPTVVNGKVYVPASSNQLLVYGLLTQSPATPLITGLVNAASQASGSVAPGEMVNIPGQNLGPQTAVSGAVDSSGNLGTQLAGDQVTFNNIPAPLLSVSAGVISAIVPFEIAGAKQVNVQVTYAGQVSATQTFNVAATAPGIFTADGSGRGQGLILNQDASINSPANPASPGSVITLYATGVGVMNPVDKTGSVAQSKAPLAGTTTATVDGHPAQVIFAGDAPGQVAGKEQVTIQLPKSSSGVVPVVVAIAGNSSQSGATVFIGGPAKPVSTSFSRRVPRMP
jgi:uncharacterized protein (TIGR03437 family)